MAAHQEEPPVDTGTPPDDDRRKIPCCLRQICGGDASGADPAPVNVAEFQGNRAFRRTRLCEKSDVELTRRISVSISSLRKPIAPATSLGRRQLRKQFCASLAQATFHTAWDAGITITTITITGTIVGTKTCGTRSRSGLKTRSGLKSCSDGVCRLFSRQFDRPLHVRGAVHGADYENAALDSELFSTHEKMRIHPV
jgi:hypothetical protein